MPELPEVEHVVRALRRVVIGRTIVASEIRLPKLIAPSAVSAFNRKVKGFTIASVGRRGKFILIQLDHAGALPDGRAANRRDGHKTARKQGLVLLVHLRMTGKFLYLNDEEDLPKHAHAIFYLDNGRRLVFRDQRQFGIMRLVAANEVSAAKGIAELAPEPFSGE